MALVQQPTRTAARPQGPPARRALIVVAMVGVLLPWANAGHSRVSGIQTHDGRTMLTAAVGALALSLAPRTRPVRTLDAALAVFVLAFALGDSDNLAGLMSGRSVAMPAIGPGLILCMAAGVAWVVTLVWELAAVLGVCLRPRAHARVAGPARTVASC